MSTMATTSETTLPEVTARKRGCLFYVKRGLLVLVSLIVVVPLIGFLYETVMAATDEQRFAPPGQIANVDGHNMHIRCMGEGNPTIIFEAGFGAWSDAWSLVQPNMSTITRTCSYDRAGLGWSAPSDQLRTQGQIATELHALLAAANIQPPYILVGHSMAGKSIRLFAAQYPQEVAGLVFVDARHESVEPAGRTPEQNAKDRADFESSLNFYRILRQAGIARLFGVPLARLVDPSVKDLPDDVVYRLSMFAVRETTLQTLMAESQEATANDDELRDAQLPTSLPVFVLTADSSLESLDNWEQGQQNLVALSSNSQRLIVKNSGHNMPEEQPQAVIDAVHAVLEAARTGEALRQ